MSRLLIIGAAVVTAAVLGKNLAPERTSTTLPDPVDARSVTGGTTATAVLAGGCFWGIEGVYEHVKGVVDVVSGYAGGTVANPTYEQVSAEVTGHAEAVLVTYDPSQVSYGELLKIFFSVAHDPTQRNRQGPDVGTQYRSAIFFSDAEQEKVAREYIAQLTNAKVFSRPIVTEVSALVKFYPAEEYHQDYMEHHPNQPYIVIHDRPKVKHLKEQFPQHYRDRTTAAKR
jgi:peptide-methionine (S)-S-oxide reductase